MTSKEHRPIFYGWWVAISCSVIYGLSGIGHYAPGIFFPFISAEMGWTQAELGQTLSIYLWVFVCAGFLAGFLVDRIGGRKTFVAGAIMQLVVPTQAVARKWFVKRAGLIAGIIAATFGIISALMFPLLTQLGDVYGWRTILRQYAIGFEVVVILLAILVVRDTPESMGLHPDGVSDSDFVNSESNKESIEEPYYTLLQALKTPQLWLMATLYS